MKHIMLALTIAFLMTACGHEGPDVDPDLVSSVNLYLSIAPDKGHWDEVISIDWGSTEEAYGTCKKTTSKLGITERKVRIDPSLHAGPTLDAIVAHELAHCLHDKKHSDHGLMVPVTWISDEYWRDRVEPAIRELFE